ncbi:MAG: TonB-dependent receptor [Pseudolabrys sp.]|nr:TonB-dependent receptor [Pseudolabrys sp.]
MQFGNWRLAFPVMLFVAAELMLPSQAQAAGGAFAVDDSEVGTPGECKVEAWTSFAHNNDFLAALAPACVLKLGIPIELGAQVQRSRSDGAWGTGGTLKAKVNLIPLAGHPFGLGLAGGAHWDLVTGVSTGGFVYLPATIELNDKFRINLNAGWSYDHSARLNYLTWGAGFEWNFVKPLTLIGEVYGQSGHLPAVEPGDPPAPNSIREPRIQLGLRYTPKENIDFDVIWGRNIGGENAHWITTGVNLRF